jgi:hypothetical protein
VPRNVVEATARSAAPRQVVWDTLVANKTKLEREGEPPPDGVGAIRVIVRRPVTLREQVELWEPPARFGYTVLSGIPVRDYHAVVTLTDAGDSATNIHWEARFDARYPGLNALLRRLVGSALADVSKTVAADAERRHGT